MLESAGLKADRRGQYRHAAMRSGADRGDGRLDRRRAEQLSAEGYSRIPSADRVLLNVAETHLDYHGDMDDYIASKAKLFANQTPDDIAVLNADDPVCRDLMAIGQLQAGYLPFAVTQQLAYGLCVTPPFPRGFDGTPAGMQSGRSCGATARAANARSCL